MEKAESSPPIPPHPMPEDLEQLKRNIINKAKELAEEMTSQHPDWFMQDVATLMKLTKDCNTTFRASLSNQMTVNQTPSCKKEGNVNLPRKNAN